MEQARTIPLSRLLACVLAALTSPAGAAPDPLAIREDRLGAWHYYDPEQPGEARDLARIVSFPSAVTFGPELERIAVLLPGSAKLVEFRAGGFFDLELPQDWAPLSLAVSLEGRLFCLATRTHSGDFKSGEWRRRYILRLVESGWELPESIPYPGGDRLEFDSHDRLWALGSVPQVGFREAGGWQILPTPKAADARNELPWRMLEDSPGHVVLFRSHFELMTDALSLRPGTIEYRDGKLSRSSGSLAPALAEVYRRQHEQQSDDRVFDRAKGYVCRAEALNAFRPAVRTIVRAGGFIVVSLGNHGLCWCSEKELDAAAPLPSDEWEPVHDVTVPPVADARGTVWLGRGETLLKIGPQGEQPLAGKLPKLRDGTVDFDQLGRPWVMAWHGSTGGGVVIATEGRLVRYPSLADALRGEAAQFQPGQVLPFAVKTPAGGLAFGSGFFETFTILDGKRTRTFGPTEIFPKMKWPTTGHGFNPFREAEPWCDARGRVHTLVTGRGYCYDPAAGRWRADPAKVEEAVGVRLPLPSRVGDVLAPFKLSVVGQTLYFTRFHFYREEAAGVRQVDRGLSPLAFYPFFQSWYESPGMTRPILDPRGRLWISPLGPYAENREWWVSRAGVAEGEPAGRESGR